MQANIIDTKASIFSNKTVVITGTLTAMSRNDAQTILEGLGAKCTNSVSKSTDFLIFGEKAGSKLEKAQVLGVKLMSEDEFIKEIANV